MPIGITEASNLCRLEIIDRGTPLTKCEVTLTERRMHEGPIQVTGLMECCLDGPKTISCALPIRTNIMQRAKVGLAQGAADFSDFLTDPTDQTGSFVCAHTLLTHEGSRTKAKRCDDGDDH
jgi:hypothetical protein